MAEMKRQAEKQPGLVIPEGQGVPEVPTGGMAPGELEYRTMLQEAIFWVTRQVLEERKEEITKRAKDRVKTLQELRGT